MQPNTRIIEHASLLVNSKNQLGEGVLWHPIEKALYWIDIIPGILQRFDQHSGKIDSWPMGSMIGTVVPEEVSGLVVALETGLYRFSAERKLSKVYDFPEDPVFGNRFNDGKCAPLGRLWVGTMNKEARKNAGTLYCYSNDSFASKLTGLTISNGMAWSADHSKFYLIDSADCAVFAFDFDLATATISN